MRRPSLNAFFRTSFGGAIALLVVGVGILAASTVNTTPRDFVLSGTQPGEIPTGTLQTSDACYGCHGHMNTPEYPYPNWKSSLMANGGRDPLFYAQMATANQDAEGVGTFCMRCHVPLAFVSGHANQADGSTLDEADKDGVNCHFCHTMVDPIYKPGISPIEDQAILATLASKPAHYGNSMFVLDPTGTRRGPYDKTNSPHDAIESPFHRTGEMCGTCHEVGNVEVSKQSDGSYRYNALNSPVPDEDTHAQFPLERTYTEWKLSAFANGGVDMKGRFGGTNRGVVSTCQDCHMPQYTGRACLYGPKRSDPKTHSFAGASSWVLEIIGLYNANDPAVDQEALLDGQQAAIEMVQKSATLKLTQSGKSLNVRVTNESGHKLPTGHIEGRRVFLNVKLFDAQGKLVKEYGHYNRETADLDVASTRVYEMKIGLSADAAAMTGLPEGETVHMSLADIIVKDNRLPPRGFNNAAFNSGGAPVVDAVYADGQYWDDVSFVIPDRAIRAEVTLYYQTVTREYIEALQHGNVTDDWGDILANLWEQTDKGPPVPISTGRLTFTR